MRTVTDVVRELQEPAGQFGKSMALCREAAELLAITDTGYQQICAKNDQLQELTKRLTETVNAAADERDRLLVAGKKIIEADDAFRAALGSHWEGDPVSDACEEARDLFCHSQPPTPTPGSGG